LPPPPEFALSAQTAVDTLASTVSALQAQTAGLLERVFLMDSGLGITTTRPYAPVTLHVPTHTASRQASASIAAFYSSLQGQPGQPFTGLWLAPRLPNRLIVATSAITPTSTAMIPGRVLTGAGSATAVTVPALQQANVVPSATPGSGGYMAVATPDGTINSVTPNIYWTVANNRLNSITLSFPLGSIVAGTAAAYAPIEIYLRLAVSLQAGGTFRSSSGNFYSTLEVDAAGGVLTNPSCYTGTHNPARAGTTPAAIPLSLNGVAAVAGSNLDWEGYDYANANVGALFVVLRAHTATVSNIGSITYVSYTADLTTDTVDVQGNLGYFETVANTWDAGHLSLNVGCYEFEFVGAGLNGNGIDAALGQMALLGESLTTYESQAALQLLDSLCESLDGLATTLMSGDLAFAAAILARRFSYAATDTPVGRLALLAAVCCQQLPALNVVYGFMNITPADSAIRTAQTCAPIIRALMQLASLNSNPAVDRLCRFDLVSELHSFVEDGLYGHLFKAGMILRQCLHMSSMTALSVVSAREAPTHLTTFIGTQVTANASTMLHHCWAVTGAAYSVVAPTVQEFGACLVPRRGLYFILGNSAMLGAVSVRIGCPLDTARGTGTYVCTVVERADSLDNSWTVKYATSDGDVMVSTSAYASHSACDTPQTAMQSYYHSHTLGAVGLPLPALLLAPAVTTVVAKFSESMAKAATDTAVAGAGMVVKGVGGLVRDAVARPFKWLKNLFG